MLFRSKNLTAHKKHDSILIAEDDDFNFLVLERLLIPYHYRIIHAKNGKEVINAFLSQKNIALILMDIQMPVMDGFTATKEIRKISNKVPIIVQTAFATEKVREIAIKSGCNDFITKPLNSDIFIETINKYID